MGNPVVNDWVETIIACSVGKILRVRENDCTVSFLLGDDNNDGSPCFSEEDVEFSEIKMITDPAKIAFLNALMDKEQKIQNLWPEWGSHKRSEIGEIRCKALMEESNEKTLAGLDEAIMLLTKLKDSPEKD